MVNKTVLGVLLFTLFAFTLAESWDIYFYNGKTQDCSKVNGCQVCDADPLASVSFDVTCSGDGNANIGLTNCKVQIFPSADCSGTGLPGVPIVDATFLDYDSACDYLEANTPTTTCNIIGQPAGSSALTIILILLAVVVVIGIVIAVVVVGFVVYKKRKAASYATTF